MAEVRHTETAAPEAPLSHLTHGAGEARATHSLADLVAELGRDVSNLVSKEIELLRAEVSQSYSNVQTAGGSLAAAAICLLAALLILLQALIVALTNLGMGAGWASLLVGVVVGIVGLVLLQNGRSLLKEGIVPKRTQAQVQRDAEMLKEQVK
ncbi:MAG TPA: phage holin family protein [Hyphomicrobiaceae bacterium]|jgi:hypothetical protein|nr:phage holin family protein [Hyphomicrobiaceae bacterium]